MKRKLLLLVLSLSLNIYGSTNDSLIIVNLQREVRNLRDIVSLLQQENRKLTGLYQKQEHNLDSLELRLRIESDKRRMDNENLETIIAGEDIKLDTLSHTVNNRSWLAFSGVIIAVVLVSFTYYVLRKKISSGATTIDKIRSAQEELETAQKAIQEETVKLDNKLMDLLDNQIRLQKGNLDDDHSLVKSIATEVVRIEQNLSFMDSRTRGVTNLRNRASAIMSTLQSKGYEIPSLIGETYHDGDNMKPTMELDEDLPVGSQIIRRVMKPMVLYKGKLIQTAEVVVAYNE